MITGGNWRSQIPNSALRPSAITPCGARDLRPFRLRARIDDMSERETNTLEDFASLYRRAFEEFGASALWSSRQVAEPTPDDALAITRSLRVEGNLEARSLAERIEQACHAAH